MMYPQNQCLINTFALTSGLRCQRERWGRGAIMIQLIPAGRYAQSRYLITDHSENGPRWQEHIADIVAAGLEFGNGPCF